MEILYGFLIFWGGTILGFFLRWWLEQERSYGGAIVVSKKDGKLLYSLELVTDIEQLQYEKQILFKIKQSDVSLLDRE